jgi:peptidoglycan/xylan/chitin deacetylase (PgdA/CDA1 family)
MTRIVRKQHVLDLLPDWLVRTHGPADGGARYLSFDDGPNPDYTARVLDLLARHGARASFFLVGQNVERHPELVARMVAEGHRIGNHSYSHSVFSGISHAEQVREIERTDKLLAAFDGLPRHPFRPPRGVFSLALLLRLASAGRRLTYWSYDSLDYRKQPANELVDALRARSPRPGDIVLMHDDNERAPRILETLLPEWRAGGFSFEPLPAEKG